MNKEKGFYGNIKDGAEAIGLGEAVADVEKTLMHISALADRRGITTGEWLLRCFVEAKNCAETICDDKTFILKWDDQENAQVVMHLLTVMMVWYAQRADRATAPQTKEK